MDRRGVWAAGDRRFGTVPWAAAWLNFRSRVAVGHTWDMTPRTRAVDAVRDDPRSGPTLARPLPVAVGAGVGLAAGIAAEAGTSGLAVGLVVGAVAAAAGIPDLCERRIPNVVVLAGLLAVVLVAGAVAVGGDRPVAGGVAGGAALGGGLLLALHLAHPAGLGFGDVKLGAVLGAAVAVIHWSLAAVTLGLASVIGALGALVLKGWRRSIPFGLCLGVAALVSVASAAWIDLH